MMQEMSAQLSRIYRDELVKLREELRDERFKSCILRAKLAVLDPEVIK